MSYDLRRLRLHGLIQRHPPGRLLQGHRLQGGLRRRLAASPGPPTPGTSCAASPPGEARPAAGRRHHRCLNPARRAPVSDRTGPTPARLRTLWLIAQMADARRPLARAARASSTTPGAFDALAFTQTPAVPRMIALATNRILAWHLRFAKREGVAGGGERTQRCQRRRSDPDLRNPSSAAAQDCDERPASV